MPNNEIEIHYPSSIPDELKSVKGLSDVMKVQIAKRVQEGKVVLQSNNSASIDTLNKCEIILEILQDRARFNKWVTIDEIKELGVDDNSLGAFVQKLMKMAREKAIAIKKSKYNGITCYKI